MYWEICYDMLMVELHSGEGKMSNEEYKYNLWSEDQLCPETAGREFKARMVGTSYV